MDRKASRHNQCGRQLIGGGLVKHYGTGGHYETGCLQNIDKCENGKMEVDPVLFSCIEVIGHVLPCSWQFRRNVQINTSNCKREGDTKARAKLNLITMAAIY